ncbi:16S rRNA (guanine(966)-N(2))-methyltransferase RsmD [Microcystis aeruginosa]|jgi:16S rRNA (guanine(966)-N(2))-methyltransferase RsmD|uniref:16S rRNA (guanine(966)-N(2))-methyltransferase RsmD n=1 Tax=Microcystis aeruginosa TaxID=1126 RepID=UPI0004696322|nr:16S rRNA (guanine(966)-N(2))-methyltransferase RsmD [Microcystis aeruginosa]MDB9396906.1 16S rRNA (guanine(966)-N(2))-methyltransferase RsmD [Microcystis aeruginosa CS-573]
MRIYGNRPIKTLAGQLTRPTTARVREALFNIWQQKLSGCRWLDLCAGNGSMGAEALCRGASLVIGIEQSGRAGEVIKENWRNLATSHQQFQVIRGDVLTKLATLAGKSFDLIYFDPPYESGLYLPVLTAISQSNLLDSLGEIAVEHNPKSWPAINLEGLTICRQKRYGNTTLTFYQKAVIS